MKTKTIITIGLLLFVCVSVAYLVIKEVRSASQSPSEKTNLPPAEQDRQTPSKVVVYYFHGTARCTTCRKFEAFTDEIIHRDFAAELAPAHSPHPAATQQTGSGLPGSSHYVNWTCPH